MNHNANRNNNGNNNSNSDSNNDNTDIDDEYKMIMKMLIIAEKNGLRKHYSFVTGNSYKTENKDKVISTTVITLI